ncbi:hypothetical protein ONE63_009825 [Megalurothrips usitatus]|uniref:Major facilitator superfamily (MFS) profile domain-containing protein n=1 Tax=Megalurothrips usitatus TaxID=439358 RepID=A0AAV7XJN8_9NEOP|nr:hypothetical protein ONE63_009825 [Megalurothrips usitatus]
MAAAAGIGIAPPRRRLGVRHIQASLLALMSFVVYTLRANMSVAVVAMIKAKTNSTDGAVDGNVTADIPVSEFVEGEVGAGGAMYTTSSPQLFAWDEWVRGALLSSFFWGYLVSQIPGGVLSHRLGGSRLLTAAILSTSIVTLLLPLCAQLGGWKAVFANRVLQGLTQGPIYPSCYTLLGLWVPPLERELFATFILASQLLGPMLASPACGMIAARWGWPSIFYAFGSAGVAMGLLMWALGADRPRDHKRISAEEVAYIEAALSAEHSAAPKKSPHIPWASMCSSPAVWALWVNLAVQAACFYTLLTGIPTFLAGVLSFSLEENGLLSALPYLTGFISSFLFTWASNAVRDRKLLSTTNNRKLFNGLASIPISVCVVATAYVSSKAMSVALICLSMGFFGSSFVSTQANFLDLAPLHTGPLYSVGNMMAATLGMLGPQIVGFIVTDTKDVSQWRIVFWGEAALLCTAFLLFSTLASGEVQPWNDPDFGSERNGEGSSGRAEF